MYNFLKNMGFIDITDKSPIKFNETLIWANAYKFDKRFIKSVNEMVTMIIIGNESDFINIYVKTCLGDKYSECYKTNLPIKYSEVIIKDMIQSNEEFIMKENNEFEINGVVWYRYCSEHMPPIGEEVISFNHKWINMDFNPKGIRVGFLGGDNQFISAFWWDYHDDYIAICKDKCESNPGFFENHLDNTEPEWWTYIPKFQSPNFN